MPRITTRRVIIATACVLTVVVATFWFVTFESPQERNFKRITTGMVVAEVEAILGPGEQVSQTSVPSYVAAVNPDEEAAFVERHRKAGTVPTAREYATRLKHFVEGDVIHYWRLGGYEIWVAFKDGKVYEKYRIDRYSL